ncbi:hypothetical protein GGI07_004521 [Coemansia sp. Benny D115]|nr:hypothetical protein GGI07_004521 [Coemansia sp. Benny D115]
MSSAVDTSNPNATRQRRKKRSRKDKEAADEARASRLADLINDKKAAAPLPENVEIEYVEQQVPTLDTPQFAQYADIFEQFAQKAARSFDRDANQDEDGAGETNTEGLDNGLSKTKDEEQVNPYSSDSSGDEDDQGDVKKTGESRKQRKRARISVAALKQIAPRPEVVEWTDTSSADPELLVSLKAIRNTVPVPGHWGQKKKYLQYKRGMEKPPFQLPEYIRATGIMEMREALKDDDARAKTTARDKIRPRMNRGAVDYQRLHDAFFRFQTPPDNLTGHGDLYYEGREADLEFDFAPGVLSSQLRTALGMPPLAPPPWLLNMQRHGPPPSYPSLVIPGLNAPIPAGAQWGFHPGGWGRPPVDQLGRPLYGDLTTASSTAAAVATLTDINPASIQEGPRKYWGDLEPVESEDQDEDEEDESGSEDEDMDTEDAENAVQSKTQEYANLNDPLTAASRIPAGLETPSVIPLRKPESSANKTLYTILPERETARLDGIMGSQYTYDLGGTMQAGAETPATPDGVRTEKLQKPKPRAPAQPDNGNESDDFKF